MMVEVKRQNPDTGGGHLDPGRDCDIQTGFQKIPE
jgi:hypothetical protein